MKNTRAFLVVMSISSIVACAPAWAGDPAGTEDLARAVEASFKQHCVECHGPVKPKAKLTILDRKGLLEKGVLVPGKAEESELYKRMIVQDETVMPPAKKPRPTKEEIEAVQKWIAAGAPAAVARFREEKSAAPATPPAAPPSKAAAQLDAAMLAEVKKILQTNCADCHGPLQQKAGITVLDRDLLEKKKKIVPGNPDGSSLIQLVNAKGADRMPPEEKSPLTAREIAALRAWIEAGAPAVPPSKVFQDTEKVGTGYILKNILNHVNTLTAEQKRFYRYFSCNHIQVPGQEDETLAEQLQLQRDALAKAINHVSMKSELVRPEPVDAAKTIYAVDIRKLGWQEQPFSNHKMNFFDLALLEYPYGIINDDTDEYLRLLNDYMKAADLIRPIPFVRSDWFASIILQPPLYEDFLRLPLNLSELEKTYLRVNTQANLTAYMAPRAGMVNSGVSRNNRVVERHTAREGGGSYYWKSFDFSQNRAAQNMFADPINLQPAGGEMVFSLPNGLNGYYIAAGANISKGDGERIDKAPTEIVTDKHAPDKAVRNGLACMRCHESGIKDVKDDVNPHWRNQGTGGSVNKRDVLQVYPGMEEVGKYVQRDRQRFQAAMEQLLGHPHNVEPLTPVTTRYLNDPIPLATASAEMGLTSSDRLRGVSSLPQFQKLGLVGGDVRRDAWNEVYDQAVKQLGLGIPIVALDGITLDNQNSDDPDLQVKLETNRKNHVFNVGDPLEVFVRNNGSKSIYYELVLFSPSTTGKLQLNPQTELKAGRSHKFPLGKIEAGIGKDMIIVFASSNPFPKGYVLQGNEGVAWRVLHDFYTLDSTSNKLKLAFDPSKVVKRTVEIETR